MSQDTINPNCEVTKRQQPSVATEVRYTALHRQVLIVYVAKTVQGTDDDYEGWRGDWKAYCVPVPGHDHDQEVHLYATVGVAVTQSLARCVNGALCERFDGLGIFWRK